MVNIRRSLFETNSSSTHAMVVYNEAPHNYPAHVHFELNNFGWAFEYCPDLESKAAYLYTSAMALAEKDNDVREKLTAALALYGVTCSFDEPKYTHYHSKYDDKDYWYLDNGGVDHCGEDDHSRWVETMLNQPEELVKFLFNDESYVITGNDNTDTEEEEWWNEHHHPNDNCTVYYKGN